MSGEEAFAGVWRGNFVRGGAMRGGFEEEVEG